MLKPFPPFLERGVEQKLWDFVHQPPQSEEQEEKGFSFPCSPSPSSPGMLFSLAGIVFSKAPHQLCFSVGLKTLTSTKPKGGRSSVPINLHPSPGICRAGAAPAKKLRPGTPSCAGPFREKNPLLPTLVILLQIFPDVT